MVRLLPRSIRHLLVCAGALGILLGHAPSQAADDASLWQNVQKAGVLRCGAAVAAPYVMRNAGSGQYSGYFVDLCRNFGEKVLKVRVEFVDTNWDNLVAGLQSGKWDLAMALNQTPGGPWRYPSPHQRPITRCRWWSTRKTQVQRAGNAIADYDKPGVTFAVMSGTAQDKAISNVVRQGRVMRLPGMDETRLALMSRRADVLVDASDTNHLYTLANAWAKEVLPGRRWPNRASPSVCAATFRQRTCRFSTST